MQILISRSLMLFMLWASTLSLNATILDTSYPVSKPIPVETPGLQPVVFMCPLWDKNLPEPHWDKLKNFPDRKPAKPPKIICWKNKGTIVIMVWS